MGIDKGWDGKNQIKMKKGRKNRAFLYVSATSNPVCTVQQGQLCLSIRPLAGRQVEVTLGPWQGLIVGLAGVTSAKPWASKTWGTHGG